MQHKSPVNPAGTVRCMAALGMLMLIALTGIATAYETPSSIEAASRVYVANVTYSPGSFFPGDEGTVTIRVTNGGTTDGVVVSHATLTDNENKFKVTSPPFTSTVTIGPGQTQTFVFSITAESISEGTFYPSFSLDFRDADSLWQRTSVQIEDAPLELTITDNPDTFTKGGKDTVKVLVWNPRETAVRAVTITPYGDGISTTPDKAYVGDLAAGASKEVSFEITPEKETTLTLTADYLNGVNEHKSSTSMPISFGTDKKGAQLVVNNIESSSSGTTMTIKGDVTNNGLTAAKSVLVTVTSPATPVNPNPVYAIGNLEPDDFSSFEVTYTSQSSTVPLEVEYKDTDGNVFTEKISINTNGNSAVSGSVPAASAASSQISSSQRRGGPFGSFGSGISQIPFTAIGIVLVALIVLVIAWRKGYLKAITKRFRKSPVSDDLPPEP